jgi:hypothetical protein
MESVLNFGGLLFGKGVEGVVCGLEGVHLADICILTRLE